MSEKPIKFLVTNDELAYLNAICATDAQASSLLANQAEETLNLTRSQAEHIRDYLTTLLAEIGFNEHYEPTRDGRLIEQLIDRLYIQ